MKKHCLFIKTRLDKLCNVDNNESRNLLVTAIVSMLFFIYYIKPAYNLRINKSLKDTEAKHLD